MADRILVVDRDRLTCSGGHGAAHLAAFLVRRHVGSGAAVKSLNILMIETPQPGENPQPGTRPVQEPGDVLVKRALLHMQQNIETPLSVDAIAARLGVGRRTLERRFAADLGAPPRRVYLDLRLDRAVAKLSASHGPGAQGSNTFASTADIALACGFCDASHLTRTLKAERGLRPGDCRR